MKDKARANLKASKTLVRKDLIDPAMSRLYYALFQVGVHALEARGRKPGDFSQHSDWKHETVCGNATLVRGRKDDLYLYAEAKDLRVQADYRPAPVLKRRVVDLIPKVEQLMLEVLP